MSEPMLIYDTCRACGPAAPLDPVLDLGPIALSDFPAQPDEALHDPIPLTLLRCPTCTLVQLRHTTPSAWMYGKQYWYQSSTNEAMVAALGDVVTKARAMVPVGTGDLVLDIGANDGTLLSWYAKTGTCPTRIAFEPVTDLAPLVRQHCEELIPAFFTARLVPRSLFKIITSIAMFYDLDDPNTFVREVASILARDGVWVIQMSYLPAMIRQTAFDNICHEHLEYYSLLSLMALLDRHGLSIVDVEENDVNGGSFRAYVQHQPVTQRDGAALQRVTTMLRWEITHGYRTPDPFAGFLWRVDQIRTHVLAAIDAARVAGGVVDVYGASTKGNTLLQFWGLDASIIRQALERSPSKWGRYTVETGIPIVSEAVGRADPAALWLVPIWHFRDAIVVREAAYLAGGGALLFPLPTAEIVVQRRGYARTE